MIAYLDLLFFKLVYFLKHGRPRPAHEVEIRRLYNERVGFKRFKHDRHYNVLRYDHGGAFDYDLYKKIQTLGNKGKLEQVFVQEDNIRILCRELEKSYRRSISCFATGRATARNSNSFFHVFPSRRRSSAPKFPITQPSFR